jgi:hypothetical protein
MIRELLFVVVILWAKWTEMLLLLRFRRTILSVIVLQVAFEQNHARKVFDALVTFEGLVQLSFVFVKMALGQVNAA